MLPCTAPQVRVGQRSGGGRTLSEEAPQAQQCDSETVVSANEQHLHGILQELRNQTFFRLVSINMDARCPLDDDPSEAGCTAEPLPFEAPPPCSLEMDEQSSERDEAAEHIDFDRSLAEDLATKVFDGEDVHGATFWCPRAPRRGDVCNLATSFASRSGTHFSSRSCTNL